MNSEQAREIVSGNYAKRSGSLTGKKKKKSSFSLPYFWDLYEAVARLFKDGAHDADLTCYICSSYQYVLRELLRSSDPRDALTLSGVPENIGEYLSLLDGAVQAYLTGNGKYLGEKRYYLHR